MIQRFSNSIICIVISVTLISLIMSCGSDDDQVIITENHLPIAVGNFWTFIDIDPGYFNDDSGSIFITGTTKLSNGKTAFIAEVTDEYGNDRGYLSRAANDLLLFHKALNDLQGELIYSPPIKVGTTWQGREGEAEVIVQETVNTPAGIFQNCFRINVRVVDDNDYYSIWLAKDVGPVKLAVIDTRDGEIESTIVLEKFNAK